MPSISSTLAASLALLTLVTATPVQLHKRKAFTLEQVERKKFTRHGPTQMARDLRRYGAKIPEGIVAATVNAAAADNNSAPAVPSDDVDSLYLTPVTIGNSTVQLDIDTGSSDLWVFSSLQASAQLRGHEYYKVDASKKLSGATWEISYGDGSGASGSVYTDKVTVGGVTATSQAVEAAESVSAQFQRDQDTDGLLGMAFSSINTVEPTPQKTWFDNVKGSLAAPVFAVTLKYHAPGTYDFGHIDKSKYTGDITYVDVDNSQGFWAFTADGYAIGDGSARRTSISAIADTGTTLLYLPAAIVEAYYAQVPGAQMDDTQGGYVFDCDTTLPDFTATIGGAKQTVPGKFINYSPLQQGSQTCFGGIQTAEGLPFAIFGDIFLKSKFVVHDISDSPRLGFAQQAGV